MGLNRTPLPAALTLFCLLVVTGCSSSSSSSAFSGVESDPPAAAASGAAPNRVHQWAGNMKSFGRQICNRDKIVELTTWEGNAWYYDGIRVFYQIGDYTGDSSWNSCAGYVREVYRPYVLESSTIPGWRVFPIGLAEDFRRTGDPLSKKAALRLATDSAFANTGGGADFEQSRETAYLIDAYLVADELGAPRPEMLAQAVTYALGHLDQWSGARSTPYIKPFMVALTMEALIHYAERRNDPRVLAAIERTANWLWTSAWNSAQGTFPYIICKSGADHQECREDHSGEGPDLNLLIAPAYAWLYSKTGDPVHAERADRIFDGGISGAWLANGKQFNQNYRWSFDYVDWRGWG